MMTKRYDVGSRFEDPKSALQMGFRGLKSARIFAGGVPLGGEPQEISDIPTFPQMLEARRL